MEEENISANETEPNEATLTNPTRWIGIILGGIFLYYAIDGGCAWWTWIVFGVLALITYAGISKIGQAVLGIILVAFVWTSQPKDDMYSTYQYESGSNNSYSSKSKTRTADEQQQIDFYFKNIIDLKAQYDYAVRQGYPESEQKRISDRAWRMRNQLMEMNLTKEENQRLSNIFAL